MKPTASTVAKALLSSEDRPHLRQLLGAACWQERVGKHGVNRLALRELQAQLHDLPAGDAPTAGLEPAPARVVPLRTPADLPNGMRRLTAVLTQVGPQIAVTDVRLTARLLAHGVHTVQQLAGHPRGAPDDAQRSSSVLLGESPHLERG